MTISEFSQDTDFQEWLTSLTYSDLSEEDWQNLLEQYQDSIGVFKEEGKCWHCGKMTKFVDLDFEAHLCSLRCQNAKIAEYAKSYNEKFDALELEGYNVPV